MSFFAILPAILSGIITIVLLFNAEKSEERVGKFWCFMLGLMFLWVTVSLLRIGLKPSYSDVEYNTNNTEYIDYDY